MRIDATWSRIAHSFRALDNSSTWARLHAEDRRLLAAGAASAAILIAVGVAAWQWQAAELKQAEQAIADYRLARTQFEQRAETERKSRAEVPPPWWTNLPASGERSAAEQLSDNALASGPKVGVHVQRFSMSPLLATAGTPYRSVTVRAEVRGTYADIKRWLGELLTRWPRSLALKTIDWRRSADGGPSSAVEASIELQLFERIPRP